MNTMTRCIQATKAPRSATVKIAASALLMGAMVIFSITSHAQQVRDFPPTALRGTLQVVAPPQVLLDGRADKLSPGARIRNAQNMYIMSGTIAGQDLPVNYTRESNGMIHEVWLLTPAEAALKRPTAKGGSSVIVGTDGKSVTFGIDNRAP